MEAKTLRARARANLAGNWGVSIGVAAVAVLLGGALVGSSFIPQIDVSIPILQELADQLNREIRFGNWSFHLNFGSGSLFGLAAFIIGGVLQLGYAQFLLKQHDGQEVEFNDLFSQFERFGDGFAQHFLRSLYTILWGLLLFIPGIVKGYSYSMTPFIMAEHPKLTASQAINLSQQMMDGHKMDLFILDLTFLGWSLLAALTGNLGYIALNPYMNAAYAAFYRQLQVENQYTSYE